ncbi:T-box transcription factor TBX20 [Amphibalanus amphitrite]|uniref:T-box transcription factor TBX20 n=1 Tax=Amphibalanus amphitrite TaxID=1232801 RepID=A0A6A4W288_AMPAM|nr:T-box transcription factor TBX20 [Amphibalanus amphitrite]
MLDTQMAEALNKPRSTDFSIAALMGRAEQVSDKDEELAAETVLEGSDRGTPEVSSTVESAVREDKEERKKAKPEGICTCAELQDVQCTLETKELWEKFHELGTEMIVTKTGRRMFPTIRVSFTGVKLEQRFLVVLDIVPADNKRYRYAYHRSSWLVAGKADPPAPARLYVHPDCPFNGEQLKKQVVSFEKIKVTNNEMDKSGLIILNSMHRYQPRVHLILRKEGQGGTITDLEGQDYKTFIFPETVFTAVTAYQNQLITKLKIDSNPFAKGFRDSSRLTDFERDTFETLLVDHPPYLPGVHPVFDACNLTAEEKTLLAARAQMMLRQSAPPTSSAASAGLLGYPRAPLPVPLPLLSQWAALQSQSMLASQLQQSLACHSAASLAQQQGYGDALRLPRPVYPAALQRYAPYIYPRLLSPAAASPGKAAAPSPSPSAVSVEATEAERPPGTSPRSSPR